MRLTDAVGRVLHEHALFRGLAARHEEMVAGCATLVTYQAGDYIYREHHPADKFYLIRHGRVALEVHVPGRAPIIVDTLRDGDPLGWSWLIPPYRTHFDARAVELVRLICFDAVALRAKMEDDPGLGYEVHKRVTPVVAARLAAARRQLLDLYGRPAERGLSWQ